ncbi:isopenicillin-N N-acyltransferase [Exophiala viscosa]|uniref:Isopenicillin-N N-acyltransferase n=1 Tax=Exophiala viscosa TaxID=2486360 RepID=A0AAN6IAQ4_9EURO|nr:isopenicillin-N N-acyltransferase [Exophiala viscosa]
MVWQGVPEIVCRDATPTEIGTLHGSLAKARIHRAIENYTSLYQETADLTWSEALERASKYVEPLEANVPDLVEEMRAIAVAAEVDFLDILALNHWTADKEDTVFLAQNWDWVGETAEATVFMDIQPQGKPRMQMFGEAGLVGKFGFNDKGLGVCMNAIRAGVVDSTKLPVHLAIRKVLECSSFEEALASINERGLASCITFTVADSTGAMASVECSPRGNVPIQPDHEGTVCHTNHLYAPAQTARVKDHPSANSFSRLTRMQELSKGTAPSFKSIRSRMSDEEGTPVSICRSRPPGAKGMEKMETLSTMIMDLKKGKAELSLGRPSLSPEIRILTMDS